MMSKAREVTFAGQDQNRGGKLVRERFIKARHLSRNQYNRLLRLIFGNEVQLARRHHVTVVVVIINAFTIFPFPGSTVTQVIIIKKALSTRKKWKDKKKGGNAQ